MVPSSVMQAYYALVDVLASHQSYAQPTKSWKKTLIESKESKDLEKSFFLFLLTRLNGSISIRHSPQSKAQTIQLTIQSEKVEFLLGFL